MEHNGGYLLEHGQFISDHIIKDDTLFLRRPLTSQSPTMSGLLSPSTMNDEMVSGQFCAYLAQVATAAVSSYV